MCDCDLLPRVHFRCWRGREGGVALFRRGGSGRQPDGAMKSGIRTAQGKYCVVFCHFQVLAASSTDPREIGYRMKLFTLFQKLVIACVPFSKGGEETCDYDDCASQFRKGGHVTVDRRCDRWRR